MALHAEGPWKMDKGLDLGGFKYQSPPQAGHRARTGSHEARNLMADGYKGARPCIHSPTFPKHSKALSSQGNHHLHSPKHCMDLGLSPAGQPCGSTWLHKVPGKSPAPPSSGNESRPCWLQIEPAESVNLARLAIHRALPTSVLPAPSVSHHPVQLPLSLAPAQHTPRRVCH